MTAQRSVERDGTPIMWTGIDKSGAARTGFAVAEHLPEWIESRWRAGWRSLTVRAHGEVLGRIERNVNGKRVWWAGPAA